MTAVHSPVVTLARDLVKRPSVTPTDAGCQALLADRLQRIGFTIEWLPFGDVTNFYARRGTSNPVLCFAGHTDVVPTGPLDQWRFPPFDAHIEDGLLHGRGSADMKGALSAMICAVETFVGAHADHEGSIAFLITSDEEGPSIDGTRRVVQHLRERGEKVDYCLIGEPSSDSALGDRVRHGRRGSLNGTLTVRGVQGHVAYPTLARNPIHDAAPLLAALAAESWDEGNADFPATSLQISNVASGTGANNVIPGHLTAAFNLRFSTELDMDTIVQRVDALLTQHKVDAHVDWHLSGAPFLSKNGALRRATLAATKAITGRTSECSTSGGTSDGRFICGWCPEVIELGVIGRSIHQIDEHVCVDDLDALAQIYRDILVRLLTD